MESIIRVIHFRFFAISRLYSSEKCVYREVSFSDMGPTHFLIKSPGTRFC